MSTSNEGTRFGFERLDNAALCEQATKYLAGREASKDAVFVLALIDHLSRRLKNWPQGWLDTSERAQLAKAVAETPREVRVMTDYALAHELCDTLQYLSIERQDLVARAIRFLRGERPRSGLTDEELSYLLQNDPAVEAIFSAATKMAHEQIARRAARDQAREEIVAIGGEPHDVPADGQLPEGVVAVPDLCERCKTAVIHRYFVAAETDPWQAWLILVQLLLLKVVDADAETENIGGAQDYQARLLAIGCLGCRYPRALREAANLVRHRGAEFAAKVMRGETSAISWDVKSLARRRR